MKQAFKEAVESGASLYEQMKFVAYSYASKRESSLEEAVYHVITELWLKRIFPRVVNANSNVPLKRIRMKLSKKKIIRVT